MSLILDYTPAFASLSNFVGTFYMAVGGEREGANV